MKTYTPLDNFPEIEMRISLNKYTINQFWLHYYSISYSAPLTAAKFDISGIGRLHCYKNICNTMFLLSSTENVEKDLHE